MIETCCWYCGWTLFPIWCPTFACCKFFIKMTNIFLVLNPLVLTNIFLDIHQKYFQYYYTFMHPIHQHGWSKKYAKTFPTAMTNSTHRCSMLSIVDQHGWPKKYKTITNTTHQPHDWNLTGFDQHFLRHWLKIFPIILHIYFNTSDQKNMQKHFQHMNQHGWSKKIS